jgi:hypothetical protein
MPTERVLVGAGVNYDPSGSNLSQYYKFNCGNSIFTTYRRVGYGSIIPYVVFNNNTQYHSYKKLRNTNTSLNLFTNKLFTGILPYQNTLDCGYLYYDKIYISGVGGYYVAPIPILMNFNLPVVVTKYRLWNGFVSGSYNIYGSDLSGDTPQDWIIQGSNDNINWTTVDTRTNQGNFPAATSRLAKNSPYVEYSIASPSAYKLYRLIVTKGGRSSKLRECSKSGCIDYYNNCQIGEIQLFGYEDPTVSCSLHGSDTMFTGVSYPGTDLTKKYNFSQIFKLENVYFDGYWNSNIDSPYGYASLKSGVIDFGTNVKITSYKIIMKQYLSGFNFYGSSNNTNWTLLDSRTSSSYGGWLSYNISSPNSYRYYKVSMTSSISCDKSGNCQAGVQNMQLMGTIG